MAGAGYNLFTTGSVLTAAQVNTFLQEQTVMRFANATARTTALSGVLAEGMMSYLDDTNSVEVYNGSAWVSVGSTGDITAVTTAGNSGLTGGATSGDVALRINTTAKGSIVAGSGASTLAELTVGANNTILTADSSTATGLKWAAASAGAMTKINTTTVTASTAFNIDSIFTSTYRRYIISFQNFVGNYPAGAVKMQLRKSGTTYATNYNWGNIFQTSNTANAWTFSSNGSDTSFNLFSPDNRATQAEIFIGNVNDSGNNEMNFYGNSSPGGRQGAVQLMNGIYLGTPNNMDGLRFTISSGSMTGTVVVYGLEK